MDDVLNNKSEDQDKTEVSAREEAILEFWRQNKVFEKTLEKEASKGEFIFYDGPPFGNGLPHYGHILAGTIKDVIPRYKTMKGYKVPRNWGWDCHGLPVENAVEKELGLKTKKDIEDYGLEKFNMVAAQSILRYEKEWKEIIPRVGRFVDMEHSYKTMDWTYTESIWWVFKTLYDKGLIYEGYKPMHICPRCETTLANFEVSQGYKDVTDISVYVRLKVKAQNDDWKNTSILAWTTTPWTLPGNVALAIKPDMEYICVPDPTDGTQWLVLGKAHFDRLLMAGIFPEEYKNLAISKKDIFLGKEMIGISYEPLFDYYSSKSDIPNKENGWKVYGADFVTETDGTGVVHIAPAFGEDDMKLGQENKLPFVQHVGMDGRFTKEVSDFVDFQAKPKDDPQKTDIEILKNLAHRGLLFAKEKVVHSYPHCWRCDTPLLNYAASSWFVKVTDIKDKLVNNNQKTSWVPDNIKDGRFGKWLEGARDWAISRSRFWGAPLPVWKCVECKKIKIVGSLEDLKQGRSSGNRYFLMRHGESEHNMTGLFSSGVKDKIHLTDKGRNEVLNSSQNLKKVGIDIIFSSDFIRTKETAEIVHKELGLTRDIVLDNRLREIDSGYFDNKPIDDYRAYFSSTEERFEKRPPGAKENLIDLKNRLADFLYEIDSKYQSKNILIVGHGDPLWLLDCASRGLDTKKSVSLKETEYNGGHLDLAGYREIKFFHLPHNNNYELDLHRPYIDEVTFKCECGGEALAGQGQAKRILDVFDCWFESGSMPYGQVHYPFENKKWFEDHFPADFIAEGLDQTRGWFYSLMVLSSALFDKPAFKDVVVNGMVLAEDGQKMSKRLQNYPDLMYVVNKYGADALRYYLLSSPAVRAEDLRFSEKGVDEVYKKITLRLYNVYSFLELYREGKPWPGRLEKSKLEINKITNVLDRWIILQLDELSKEVSLYMDKYEIDKAARPIALFVEDLSTWYLRRSRERFKAENHADKIEAITALEYVLQEFCKILSPFMPFQAEDIYLKVKHEDARLSVHLENWPELDITSFETQLLVDMAKVRQVVSLGLEARANSSVKVRQPLASLTLKNLDLKDKESLLGLIKDELNIKQIFFDDTIEPEVKIDTNITDDLRLEGLLRELVRNIQDLRKKDGLMPEDRVILEINGSEKEEKLVKKYQNELAKMTGARKVEFGENTEGRGVKIEDLTFLVKISK